MLFSSSVMNLHLLRMCSQKSATCYRLLFNRSGIISYACLWISNGLSPAFIHVDLTDESIVVRKPTAWCWECICSCDLNVIKIHVSNITCCFPINQLHSVLFFSLLLLHIQLIATTTRHDSPILWHDAAKSYASCMLRRNSRVYSVFLLCYFQFLFRTISCRVSNFNTGLDHSKPPTPSSTWNQAILFCRIKFFSYSFVAPFSLANFNSYTVLLFEINQAAKF